MKETQDILPILYTTRFETGIKIYSISPTEQVFIISNNKIVCQDIHVYLSSTFLIIVPDTNIKMCKSGNITNDIIINDLGTFKVNIKNESDPGQWSGDPRLYILDENKITKYHKIVRSHPEVVLNCYRLTYDLPPDSLQLVNHTICIFSADRYDRISILPLIESDSTNFKYHAQYRFTTETCINAFDTLSTCHEPTFFHDVQYNIQPETLYVDKIKEGGSAANAITIT